MHANHQVVPKLHDGEPFSCTGAYVRGAGGGIGEDAMEEGLGRDAPGAHEDDDKEDLDLSRSCAGLLMVYFRKMQGVRDVGPP